MDGDKGSEKGGGEMIEENLVTLLKQFGFDVKRSVFEPNTNEQHPDQYFVLNIATMPYDFADDAPDYEKYLIQIHLYAPLSVDITEIVRAVKHTLFGAGFIYPTTEDASDESGRHIVFETENVEAIDYGEA